MNQAHIVVVDDDDEVRAIVVAVAKEAAPTATVTEHVYSFKALEEITNGAADLLITNCHMPDMDGPTLVRTIRKMQNSIPIIMVSGSEDAHDLGILAGIDRFVPKFEIYSTLTEAIQSLLAA
jgi:CheY-like chemotaxis protein